MRPASPAPSTRRCYWSGLVASTGTRRRSAARRRSARRSSGPSSRPPSRADMARPSRQQSTAVRGPMSEPMRAIAMGVHVLDVLARPVEVIPEGQGGVLVEQIRAAPAGSAGGTAVTLAKLGADVRSAGAIGSDPLGDLLVRLLEDCGVDTSLLVRREDLQTSASVLPIRPNGD